MKLPIKSERCMSIKCVCTCMSVHLCVDLAEHVCVCMCVFGVCEPLSDLLLFLFPLMMGPRLCQRHPGNGRTQRRAWEENMGDESSPGEAVCAAHRGFLFH